MHSEKIGIALILRQLDVPFTIETVNDRVIIQKLIYLASQAKVKIGDFKFTLYKRGPYCPELTPFYYDLERDIKSQQLEFLKYDLKDESKNRLIKVKEIYDFDSKSLGLKKAEWLELISTLILIGNNYVVDKEGLKTELFKLKPNLINDVRFKIAYDIAISSGLLVDKKNS